VILYDRASSKIFHSSPFEGRSNKSWSYWVIFDANTAVSPSFLVARIATSSTKYAKNEFYPASVIEFSGNFRNDFEVNH